jgi:hypothetical protein
MLHFIQSRGVGKIIGTQRDLLPVCWLRPLHKALIITSVSVVMVLWFVRLYTLRPLTPFLVWTPHPQVRLSVLLFGLCLSLCRNIQATRLYVPPSPPLLPKVPPCFRDTKFPFNVVYTLKPLPVSISLDATPSSSASNFSDFVYCNEIASLYRPRKQTGCLKSLWFNT